MASQELELIGMLDSPYVRRVAVAMHLMGLPFTHRPVSVFRDYAPFQAVNPVVKAPTLVAGNGLVLMESGLILQYLETLVPPTRRLTPPAAEDRLRAWQLTGLALAACEKSVQIVYERQLRPPEKQHQPWLDRVEQQLRAAYAEIERRLARQDAPRATTAFAPMVDIAGVSTAVAWHFTQQVLPGLIAPAAHPRLADWSAQAEGMPAFAAAPYPA